MVHENCVHVIVMVTNEVEGDRLKCHRYWPSAGEGQVCFCLRQRLATQQHFAKEHF